MLVAAAVCPHPPLLVPQLAAGAAPELDGLRAACDDAVARLVAAGPEVLVVVGSAPRTGLYPPAAWGSLAGYGVDVLVGATRAVPARAGSDPPPLPLSLTIGRWLLDRQWPDGAPRATEVRLTGVHPATGARACADLGRDLAGGETRTALLAMGDSSARRSVKGPGYLDERAARYDASVTSALARADPAALLRLDPMLDDRLLVAGRAAWQVLAGAATGGSRMVGEVRYVDAPYGVAYVVAIWEPAAARHV